MQLCIEEIQSAVQNSVQTFCANAISDVTHLNLILFPQLWICLDSIGPGVSFTGVATS